MKKDIFHLDTDWERAILAEGGAPDLGRLQIFLKKEEEAGHIVYPARDEIFSAFNITDFKKVRVVIIGQDPYHGEGQAHGLAFSVRKGVRLPPSLRNIYKEIEREFDVRMPAHGDLTGWAEQGVLLLNATLTVRQAQAGSHQRKGWEEFTDAVIRAVNEKRTHVVFMLWGAYAQKKGALIDRKKHLVLEAAHPSPLSARNGFFGCGHFRQANEYLTKHGQTPIAWERLD